MCDLNATPFLPHLDICRQAEDLKASTIGQDWSRPAHEPMQTAAGHDRLQTWAKHKVVSVCQDDLRAGSADLTRQQSLDRRLRSHRHKHRRFNRSPLRLHGATPSARIRVDGDDSEGEVTATRVIGSVNDVRGRRRRGCHNLLDR